MTRVVIIKWGVKINGGKQIEQLINGEVGTVINACYVSMRFPKLKDGNKIYNRKDEIRIIFKHFINFPREIQEINKQGV